MIGRILDIHSRYVTANLVLNGTAPDLTGPDNTTLCRVTAVRWANRRLTVHGQQAQGTVTLDLAGMQTSATGPDNSPFALSLPWPPNVALQGGKARLTHSGSDAPISLRFRQVRLARVRLTLRFAVTLVRIVPDTIGWFRRGDNACKARIKATLGLNPPVTKGPLDTAVFRSGRSPLPPQRTRATIIVPVYDAFELLETCLGRVQRNTDLDWRLILIEDGSSDPRVRPFLQNWVKQVPDNRVTLIEHDKNRGFIASVNAALDILLSRDDTETGSIILLNSDAFVPPGWAARLIAPLLSDSDIASVTPMSNDAEIFSVPAICARTDLAPGQAEAIDRAAHELTTTHIAPTGVGFCMAMSRRFLNRVPQLDTAFGRGYGEEVDWCQKTRKLGGKHLGLAGLFVEHKGGASFGTAEKTRLIATNNARISARYPGYDREVQEFLLQDPLRSARMALAVGWVAATAGALPVPIYIAHSLGGGAENWLRARLSKDTSNGSGAVVVRVGGTEARWQLEVHSAAGEITGWSDDFDTILRFLAPLPHRNVIYSCGVGDRDPSTLPEHILRLLRSADDRLEVMFHDYLPVSPSFTLLDTKGHYHGPPSSKDSAHRIHRPNGRCVELEEWQAAWGQMLARAELVKVFCPSGAALVKSVWPNLSNQLDITPHRMLADIQPLPDVSHQPPVLAVLGNIAPHKGAGLVQALARLPTAKRRFKLVLIGNIDPNFPLPRGTNIHGDYNPEDITGLCKHYGVTHWLIPSIWPETFSFTTREALATGYPVLAFDIGAQGDAVRKATNGIPMHYDPATDLVANIVATMHNKQRSGEVPQ